MAHSVGSLVLVRGLSRVTWQARLDGSPVIARAVTSPIEAGLDSPLLVPVLGAAELDGATWLLSENVEGVSAHRLLGLATLTAAQAAWLASRAFAALATLHAAGRTHGRLHAGNVLVDRNGSVRIADWALGPPATEPARRADLEAARAFVVALLRNAGRPAVLNGGRPSTPLAELERLAGEPISDPAIAARELDVAVDDASIVTSELGALATAMVRSASPAVTPAPLPPRRSPPRRPPRRIGPPRWVVAAVAALVVLAAAAATAFAVTHRRHEAANPPRSSSSPPSHASTTTRSQAPNSTALARSAAVAPRRAGFVNGVVVTPVETCQPGATCSVTVTIQITEHADVKHLTWRFVLVNPCTGARTNVPGGSMTAQPNWRHVYATTKVPIPPARSVALVAMTTVPVRAASAPLTVPSGHAQC